METKNLSSRLIQLLEQKGFEFDEATEKLVRSTVQKAFQEGYGDCLNDADKGLIKLPHQF